MLFGGNVATEFLCNWKAICVQVSPGIMLHASKSTHSARGSFLGPLPTPLIFSDLIHVVHNQRGMSSPLLPCLGDIIFLLPGKAPSDSSHSTQGSSACRPSRLIGSLRNYNWEQTWLHMGDVSACITEVTQGHIHAHWSCSVIIFPKRPFLPLKYSHPLLSSKPL